MTDSISEPAIREELRQIIGETAARTLSFELKAETASTSDDAKRAASSKNSPEGTVIVADHQTAGRGRRENRWESPPGRNLMFSIVLRPSDPIEFWSRIPHLVGLAVARGIESAVSGIDSIQLKWPNDLMLDGKKLGGILVESQLSRNPEQSFCIAGVGININIDPAEFPPALRLIAVSLAEKTGHFLSRSKILAHILAEWLAIYPDSLSSFEPTRSAIERRSFLSGHLIEVHTGSDIISGKALEVGPDGELRIDTGKKIVEIRAAERVRRVDSA